ncbi:MAG: hypothetical protein IMZ57_01515 [Acidobacteria bacterium]|nr:hypothetical protein [Acidobacteriota bacterium]
MRAKNSMLSALFLLAIVGLCSGQEAPTQDTPKPPEPLFVRVTVYPTASLSRYDYNNDIDIYEVRVYVELRRGSQEGEAVADARVTALAQKLDYQNDLYEKRIILEKDDLPAEVEVEIAARNRPVIREKFPLSSWLVLKDPRPAVVEAGKDLPVRWRFSRFSAPVDVRAYDFKTGKEFFRRDHEADTETLVSAADLPASTIVRIYIIQSWLYKRFLAGDAYARGSEVNVIPWSQVFIRTK